jgi:integrase/recombinase XerD
MSRDSAARPHELLRLRIKDVVFKLACDKKQYAEMVVNGKTGSRSIPLINAIPHIKDWLSQHPQGANPHSILLCGSGKSLGKVMNVTSYHAIYEKYKKDFFPRLLASPNVPPEEKQEIRELLKKPWNPYIRRHSALTEKSGILKEHYLRQYAGWTPSSQMHLKYLHYFGDESSGNILEAYGIITKNKELPNVLEPKQCPNCSEPNKPDSRFCVKCRMVLTYDAYTETIEQKEEKDMKLEELIQKQARFEQLIQSLIDTGQMRPTTN